MSYLNSQRRNYPGDKFFSNVWPRWPHPHPPSFPAKIDTNYLRIGSALRFFLSHSLWFFFRIEEETFQGGNSLFSKIIIFIGFQNSLLVFEKDRYCHIFGCSCIPILTCARPSARLPVWVSFRIVNATSTSHNPPHAHPLRPMLYWLKVSSINSMFLVIVDLSFTHLD